MTKDKPYILPPAVDALAKSAAYFRKLEDGLDELLTQLADHRPSEAVQELKQLAAFLRSSHFRFVSDIEARYPHTTHDQIRTFLVDDIVDTNEFNNRIRASSGIRGALLGSHGLVSLLSSIASPDSKYNEKAKELAGTLIRCTEDNIRPVLENPDLMAGLESYAHDFLKLQKPVFLRNDGFRQQVGKLHKDTEHLLDRCGLLVHNMGVLGLKKEITDAFCEDLRNVKDKLQLLYNATNAIEDFYETVQNQKSRNPISSRNAQEAVITAISVAADVEWLNDYETLLVDIMQEIRKARKDEVNDIKRAEELRHALRYARESGEEIEGVIDTLANEKFADNLKDYAKTGPFEFRMYGR